jgi:hypothetical protein
MGKTYVVVRARVEPPCLLKHLIAHILDVPIGADNLEGSTMITEQDIRMPELSNDLIVQSLRLLVCSQVCLKPGSPNTLVFRQFGNELVSLCLGPLGRVMDRDRTAVLREQLRSCITYSTSAVYRLATD